MYRKDFIQSEIQKLEQVLAKILGLKREGKIEEAHQVISSTLQTEFNLKPDFLNSVPAEDFSVFLTEKNYPEKKLDLLAQLFFESAHPFEEIPETVNRLHLVLVIFNYLEQNHHMQSLDNLAKREMIDKFLNTGQYE